MLKRTVWILFIVGVLSLNGKASEDSPILSGKLTPGRFAVGFRLVNVSDPQRTAADQNAGRGRPLQLAVWYPAKPSNRAFRLTLSHYLQVSDDPETLNLQRVPLSGELHRSLSLQISSRPDALEPRLLDRLLASPMWSAWEAAPVAQRLPLVLWSARHGTIFAQSILCEYLASQGYIVAFARYKGQPMPLPYQAKSDEEKQATLVEHVKDLQVALAVLSRLPNVNASKTAVLSWSYAGESATLLQLQQRDIDLVISLSSNVLTGWVYQGAGALAKIDVSRLTAPYVLMTEKVATNGEERMAPEVLGRLPAGGHFIRFNDLAHGNFNAAEGMIPGVARIAEVPRWSKTGPVAQLGYETVCRYVLHFLNHYLKPTKNGDPLKGWDYAAGLPQGFVEIQAFRAAQTRR